ncbi:aminotransferase class I/II-fold pyridoxal phosphate-dependent enzyme [Azospirillum brasilense]|uniref:MocR-like pyridoxine biosynthesis transcription factor PdxR n=1 Tax=Azospirillum brasilense TaxID=192 RepID=UPI00190C7F53|nr:PLP-dependent aminotransferase family protein [Azospirillum brasilense]MBK3735572.1 aminotransferase class I/II-fold pyridoxal phosphate-dependent enzyme [Azospirillum brasilense]
MPPLPPPETLDIALSRTAKVPLSTQIHAALRDAIRDGRLPGGARLPSWRDLAVQLGVSRGTVRDAYERLIDEQLAVGLGAAGTRVAEGAMAGPSPIGLVKAPSFLELFSNFERAPLPFQMGVPAQDAFPFTLWSRIVGRAARAAAAAPVGYPDPRGHPDLRREIAAVLAIARGIRCTPEQIFVTAGYSGALGLVIRALRLDGATAWMEEPGFPLTRRALHLAGMTVVPVPADAAGIDVDAGLARAPAAGLAVVTPGQQAPLGVTMTLQRRLALLDWASRAGAWIVEDDYLSELQLKGRAAPALASLDRDGRVLHAGTFSKTITPALRLGFLMVPPGLAGLFGEAAACLSPAPAATMQRAVADFMAGGHYFRHLRRMKRLYAVRQQALLAALRDAAAAEPTMTVEASGSLSVRLVLPPGRRDIAVAAAARADGLAPVPLSPWYADGPEDAHPRGLLLGITNLRERRLPDDCRRLIELVKRNG